MCCNNFLIRSFAPSRNTQGAQPWDAGMRVTEAPPSGGRRQ